MPDIWSMEKKHSVDVQCCGWWRRCQPARQRIAAINSDSLGDDMHDKRDAHMQYLLYCVCTGSVR